MRSDKYEKIFQHNKEWLASKKEEDSLFFRNRYDQQNPDFLYIGCSDSRV